MRIHFSHTFATEPTHPLFRPLHGPIWEGRQWWKPLAVRFCSLTVHAPSTGYRLWVYARRGSFHFDVYFDRRGRGRA